MSDQPATKGDLKKLEATTGHDLKKLEATTQNEFKKLEYKFLNSLDKVMGQLKLIREELAATFGLYQRHNETLEDHEERLTKIEKKVATPF